MTCCAFALLVAMQLVALVPGARRLLPRRLRGLAREAAFDPVTAWQLHAPAPAPAPVPPRRRSPWRRRALALAVGVELAIGAGAVAAWSAHREAAADAGGVARDRDVVLRRDGARRAARALSAASPEGGEP